MNAQSVRKSAHSRRDFFEILEEDAAVNTDEVWEDFQKRLAQDRQTTLPGVQDLPAGLRTDTTSFSPGRSSGGR